MNYEGDGQLFPHRTAIEKNPDLSTALIGMGQTLFSNRLFAEAGECFEHAVPKVCFKLIVFQYFKYFDMRKYMEVTRFNAFPGRKKNLKDLMLSVV